MFANLPPLLWSGSHVLFPLVAFAVLFFAAPGRRLLPALGLVLVLIDGVGDLIINWVLPGMITADGAGMVSRHALNVAYAIGLLLVVIGIVRRVDTGSGRVPDPGWEAPPSAPAVPGGPGHIGYSGSAGQRGALNLSGGHVDPAARPSGPSPGPSGHPPSDPPPQTTG